MIEDHVIKELGRNSSDVQHISLSPGVHTVVEGSLLIEAR
jgi:hypothetical protein